MGCGATKVSKEEVKYIQKRSGGMIAEKDIHHWHKIWRQIAPDGKMTQEQFVKFIVDNKIGQEHDAVNMFKMMDKDKNKSMDFAEFVLILVLPKSPEEITAEQFANLCMTIYDEDGNGVITKEELLNFAIAKAKAEGRNSPEEQAQITEIVNKIVAYIDVNTDGQISRDELAAAINRDPYLKKVL